MFKTEWFTYYLLMFPVPMDPVHLSVGSQKTEPFIHVIHIIHMIHIAPTTRESHYITKHYFVSFPIDSL